MIQPPHPLIAAAVEPLAGNAEQQLAAIALLEETFDAEHPAVSETLSRFGEVDSGKWGNILRWLLPALAVVSLIALAAHVIPRARLFVNVTSFISSIMSDPSPVPPRDDLSPEQKLLLGDPRKSNLAQKQALTESDPTRPDFYAEYALAHINEHKELPDGYFETVARIDPDNAFFLFYGAAVIGEDSVKRIRLTPAQKENNEPQRYDILDEAALDKAIALFHEARGLPKFDTYASSMLSTRITLLEQGNMVERISSIAYVAAEPSIGIRFRKLGDAVGAASMRFAENDDSEGFRGLLEDNEHFLKLWTASPVCTLVDELVFNVWAVETNYALLQSATKLGVESEIPRLSERKKHLDERNAWKKQKGQGSHNEKLFVSHSGLLHGLTLPMVARQVRAPVAITKQDLKPGVMLDHDVASEFFLAAACVILLLAMLGVFLFRFRSSGLIRKVSARLEGLLGARDWAWILLGGVVFPFLCLLFINRFTPLGGRDYGIRGLGFVFPFIHFLILLLAFLSAPVLLARWRLREKTAPFGLGHRKSTLGWVLLGGGLLVAIMAFPIFVASMEESTAFAILVLPLIWTAAIVITCMRAIFGKRNLRISRDATARLLIPAYSLAIILLASLYPALLVSERHWIAEDKLMTLDPKFPGMTPYEYKVTAQLRDEIKGMLGLQPQTGR